MSKLIDLINKNSCDFLGKISLSEIDRAQKDLNVKFSQQVIDYISEFGALSYGSNEINGLGTDNYLNIVKATMNARNDINNFPINFAVIQDIGIQGILILVDESNNVYEWNGSSYKKIYESFYDFLNREIFI